MANNCTRAQGTQRKNDAMCYGHRYWVLGCCPSRISHQGARQSGAPPPISWSIPGLLAQMAVSTVLIHSSFSGMVLCDFRFWQGSWKKNLSESETPLSTWEYICVMIWSTSLAKYIDLFVVCDTIKDLIAWFPLPDSKVPKFINELASPSIIDSWVIMENSFFTIKCICLTPIDANTTRIAWSQPILYLVDL